MDAQRISAMVKRIVGANGADATLNTKASRTFDPLTGTVSGPAEASTPARIALRSRHVRADDGQIVTQTVATLTIAPTVGEYLTVGGTRYRIEEVETMIVGAVPVAYVAVLER
jgi:hypothetical protein